MHGRGKACCSGIWYSCTPYIVEPLPLNVPFIQVRKQIQCDSATVYVCELVHSNMSLQDNLVEVMKLPLYGPQSINNTSAVK